jgi:hypothetical protein
VRFDYPTKTVYKPKWFLYLGTKLTPDQFTVKCFTRGDDSWEFGYPEDRLLPLMGTITNNLMRNPDMWDLDGQLCLLVVKSGNATNTATGRTNGELSIVRDYFQDMSITQTSMEWGIRNYDSKSEVFSEPGDSGSVIADIRGRIGETKSSDMTYATPFWWLLERIKVKGFPDAPRRCTLARHQQRHRGPFVFLQLLLFVLCSFFLLLGC